MAYIADPTIIQGGSRFPSLGTLIGSRVSGDILNQGRLPFKSLFGAEHDQRAQQFVDQYVAPMDKLSIDLAHSVNMVWNPDHFRVLETVDDFKSIPACMELPILMFAPVRALFDAGQIDGFGFDPTTLPDEDVYGRLLNNFACDDVEAASDDQGYFPLSAEFRDDDPEYSDDELYALRRTREYIERIILKETDRDPTAIELPRG